MIIYKSQEQIEKINQGGKILASIMETLLSAVKPGLETGELEEMAEKFIREQGGRGAFKGYQTDYANEPFKTNLCTSINQEIVHAPALPSRVLKQGDILSIDIGLEYKGLYTDMARTIGVGEISAEAVKLIKITRTALDKAISAFEFNQSLARIGRIIEEYVASQGFSVVRDLVGHGVGVKIHEDPAVPNFYAPETENILIKPGMVLAFEPMVNLGGWQVEFVDDWIVKTADNSISAHFEDTVMLDHNNNVIIATRI